MYSNITKPAGKRKLNKNLPITKGLVFDCPLESASGLFLPIDLVTGIRATSGGSGSKNAINGRYGWGVEFNNTGQYFVFDSPLIKSFNQITIQVIFLRQSGGNGGGYGALTGLRDSTNSIDWFSLENDNNNGGWGTRLNCFYPATEKVWSVAYPTNNIWHNYIARYDHSNKDNVPDVWAGLSKIGLTNRFDSGWTRTINANRVFIANKGSGTGSSWDGYIKLVRIWNRLLTTREIFSLNIDPWITYEKVKPTLVKVATGTATSDTRNAVLTGKESASDTRNAVLTGKDTTSDTRGAVVTGKEATSDTRGAVLTGKDTATDNRGAVITGKDTSTDNRGAILTGADSTFDTRGAVLTGKDTTNDSRGAVLTGIEGANDTRNAILTGTDATFDTRGAVITGKDTATDNRGATITGEGGSNSDRGAVVTGQDATNATRGAVITGKDTSFDSRGAILTGVDAANSERGAVVTGKDTTSDTRNAVLTGKETASEDRYAVLTGTDRIISERNAILTGFDTIISERGAILTGFAIANSERGAIITGKLDRGRPTVLPGSIGATILGSRQSRTIIPGRTPTIL